MAAALVVVEEERKSWHFPTELLDPFHLEL